MSDTSHASVHRRVRVKERVIREKEITVKAITARAMVKETRKADMVKVREKDSHPGNQVAKVGNSKELATNAESMGIALQIVEAVA